MGNRQKLSPSCNESIGNFNDVTSKFCDLPANAVVYEIRGSGRFPCFYYDYGEHTFQINSWLDSIESSIRNSIYPFRPMAIIDPPKAGKSAFLFHLMPHLILKRFGTAKIIHLDFVKVPLNMTDNATDELRPFARMLLTTLQNGCNEVGLHLTFNFNDFSDVSMTIIEAFRVINTECSRRDIICFMLWDEVQRWFQLRNMHSAALFDSVTLHQSFKNLAFAVTGSGMVQIFNSIIDFPSNGTHWLAQANLISLSPGTADLSNDIELSIKDEANDNIIANYMVNLLRHYHKDVLPNRLLEFVPDKSPAVMGYFCELHLENIGSNRDTDRAMRRTLGKCYEKLFLDFKHDCLPLLKTIASQHPDFFYNLVRIASSTLLLSELSGSLDLLQQWRPFFETLLRCITIDTRKFVCFSRYYGYLIIRSVKLEGSTFKIMNIQSFNKLPVPSLWATISLVHEIVSAFNVAKREQAELVSLRAFNEFHEAVEDGKWVYDRNYAYFFRLNANDANSVVISPGTTTPYLELLRLIRNATCHIKTLSKISEISGYMPICLYVWVRALMKLCNTK